MKRLLLLAAFLMPLLSAAQVRVDRSDTTLQVLYGDSLVKYQPEGRIDRELDQKVSVSEGTPAIVYGTNLGGQQTPVPYSSDPEAFALVMRDIDNYFKVENATDPQHPASKYQLDSALATTLATSGGEMSGGLSFGSATVDDPQDLSRHISLYSTGYGISITSQSMNFNIDEESPAKKYAFYEGTTLIAEIQEPITNPTALITKDYLDTALAHVQADTSEAGAWDNLGDPQVHTGQTTGASANGTQVHLVDCTAGDVMFNLPDSLDGTKPGKPFTVKKIDASANGVDIDAGEANIDGQASQGLASQYSFITVVFDGTNYHIIGRDGS